MADPKVLVATATTDRVRVSQFYDHLKDLIMPPGSATSQNRNASIARARNDLVGEMLEGGYTHIFFLDDDHAFAPDVLMRLLAHQSYVVSGLYTQKVAPFGPVLVSRFDGSGQGYRLILRPGMNGLITVAGCGMGCCLIERSVLVRLTTPWFVCGTPIADQIAEDFTFCRRVSSELDLSIWADLDTRVGHYTQGAIWPAVGPDGGWITTLAMGGGKRVNVPGQEALIKSIEGPRILVP